MEDTVVKTYRGREREAMEDFRKDAQLMAAQGYQPLQQTYAAGTYGCAAFILALLLCVLVIGLLIFIYMVIVKPPGILTVTYGRTAASKNGPTKACPQCAEVVKDAAIKCRFCGFDFPMVQEVPSQQFQAAGANTGTSSQAHGVGMSLGRLWAQKPSRYGILAVLGLYFLYIIHSLLA